MIKVLNNAIIVTLLFLGVVAISYSWAFPNESTRLMVRFIDSGEGVDAGAITDFKNAILDAERTLQCDIEYSSKSGSNPGEKTFCFPSSNGACLESFVSSQKTKYSGRNDVIFSEFTSCD